MTRSAWRRKRAGRARQSGAISNPAHCRAVIEAAASPFGRVNVLVNNAAFQRTHSWIEKISDEEWDHTFDVNSAPRRAT